MKRSIRGARLSGLGIVVCSAFLVPPGGASAADGPESAEEQAVAEEAQASDASVRSLEGGWGRKLYYKVRPSIVLISSGDAEGTGFLFHTNQYVATALHVVNHTGDLAVITTDGKRLAAQVVAWDAEWDLALLRLDAPLEAAVLRPVSANSGQVGEPVAAIGNPWGAEQRRKKGSEVPVLAISQGVVSAPPSDYVQTDAPVNPGNSGGPLLTPGGEVVGVVVVRIAEADGISFATSVAKLTELTKRIDSQGAFSPDVQRVRWQLGWVPAAEYQLSGIIAGARVAVSPYTGITLRGARLWGDTLVASSFELTQRDRWLVEAEASLFFGNQDGGVALGVGVATQWDTITDRTATVAGANIVEAKAVRNESNTRLLLSASLYGDPVLLDTAVYMLGDEGLGARLGLGVTF